MLNTKVIGEIVNIHVLTKSKVNVNVNTANTFMYKYV